MTTIIPLEAKTFEYVPESLRDIEGAPKFMLRYGTHRDKHLYKAEIAGRGLVSYSDEDIRAAMVDEMRRLSGNTDEAKDHMVETAQRYWAANEAHNVEIKLWAKDCDALRADDIDAELPPFPVLDFDAEEQAWIVGIMETVQASSPVLRNMNKANIRRDRIAREAALSSILISVEGFDLLRDMDGLVSNLGDLEEWLGDRAEELGIEEILAGNPFSDLLGMAFMAFHLPKATEKNFASLLLATSALSGSQAAAAADDSTSPMSEKSTETPSSPDNMITSETSSTSPCPAEADSAELSGQTAGP